MIYEDKQLCILLNLSRSNCPFFNKNEWHFISGLPGWVEENVNRLGRLINMTWIQMSDAEDVPSPPSGLNSCVPHPSSLSAFLPWLLHPVPIPLDWAWRIALRIAYLVEHQLTGRKGNKITDPILGAQISPQPGHWGHLFICPEKQVWSAIFNLATFTSFFFFLSCGSIWRDFH